MSALLTVLQVIVGLGSLACFIMVLVKMFQQGDTGMGIACIVLIFACGIGGLLAFIMGWVKHAEYGIYNVMVAWTGLIVVGIILNAVALSMGAGLQA